MKIIFIGTGSGKTSKERFHSSIYLETAAFNLLIDAGDGVAKALMNSSIDFNSINGIIFTHYHADHFTGIGALITQMKIAGRKRELTLFTHKNLVEPLINLLYYVYMFPEALGFNLKIIGYRLAEKVTVAEDFSFMAKQNSHIYPKGDIEFYSESMFVSSSLSFTIAGNSIVYTSDVGSPDDLYLFDTLKPDVFITEMAHIEPEDLYLVFKKINPGRIFITHIDDEKFGKLVDWYENLDDALRDKITICHDGLVETLG
ncbi:MBL fold metallo-hydrolase [Melioribacter sp. OK-6-Me]|uniref:MBL fold metallo-hydrolase n=1 Tax=unclassified Melioribacter TaxID=2627329 RepID=UPI003EDABAF1